MISIVWLLISARLLSMVPDLETGCGTDGRFCETEQHQPLVERILNENNTKMNMLAVLTDSRISQFDKLETIECFNHDFSQNKYLVNVFMGGLMNEWNFIM
jgi:hypothetical protein